MGCLYSFHSRWVPRDYYLSVEMMFLMWILITRVTFSKESIGIDFPETFCCWSKPVALTEHVQPLLERIVFILLSGVLLISFLPHSSDQQPIRSA